MHIAFGRECLFSENAVFHGLLLFRTTAEIEIGLLHLLLAVEIKMNFADVSTKS